MTEMTPMMKQYMSIKEKYKDSILFFRLGDFYEMFFEDALIASKELELTLTQRESGLEEKAPMCGVPHHVAEQYIYRLVEKGYKVAVCDQVEDPALAKGIVKREIVKVVTPGTIVDSLALDEKSNNFLASIYFDDYGVGLSYVDNSTGEIYTTQFITSESDKLSFLVDELGKIMPSELIINSSFTNYKREMNFIKNKLNPYINIYEEKSTSLDTYKLVVNEFFSHENISNNNLDEKIYCYISLGKLLEYLKETQFNKIEHIDYFQYYEPEQYMVIDLSTRTNLEINETIRGKSKKGALINILDKTVTSIGGRLLKKWLEQPLINQREIEERLNIVEYFTKNLIILDEIRSLLKNVYDLERLSTKIVNGVCNARDLLSLKISIEVLPEIKNLLTNSSSKILNNIGLELDDLRDIFIVIQNSISEDAPISVKDGGIIKENFSKDLDELREISRNSKKLLAEFEAKQKDITGIKNLKVGYNRVVGYYIEVTKTNVNLIPDYYIRKQTLSNSERYFTEELKEIEEKILGADEKAIQLEYELFQKIREDIKSQIKRVQKCSKKISYLDVLSNFAYVAVENNYVRPKFNNNGIIEIYEGRHPVVEKLITNQEFIPNDLYLDNKENMIYIITGPNMAGKSTFMRQVAIITLMSQIGSFVPAKKANISIVDRIFTRIGASDNLTQGESTFMVEMNEVSNIVKNATSKSLIVLDEVGRGTSTYDGLSIAWAVVEYIASNIKAKTLFATHYHELTEIEKTIEGVKNYHITVKESGEDIIFLRKIVEGKANKSFGIQVAKLSGLHQSIINRANEILELIGSSEFTKNNANLDKSREAQLSLIDFKKDYFIEKISNIDINSLTPIKALNILNELIVEASKLKE
ncbi:MAG: DNA mismatch repair protein MutS [Tissierellales bacterium]|nr:DNA mismatch repair protein MutS [Tissierellales bacterium]